MKAKMTLLGAGLCAAVCVAGWTIASGMVESDPPPAPVSEPAEATASPVVVTPPSNFDLEVTSPADLGDATDEVGLSGELPTADLTWYDPVRLDAAANLS